MPDTKGQQVTITLPPGVSAEAYKKSYESWQNQRIATGQRDKATREANARLKSAHEAEFDKYYKEEYAKVMAETPKM
jgi:tripartite-type tricarboxylate transporter receptor subunit TctC